jgi:hypothetical protein
MPDITPSFVMQYERRMRAITETEYVRRLAAKNIWWNKVARVTDIEGKTERMTWFLDTAMIEPVGPTGTGALAFENMVTQTAEYPTFRHGKGIIIQRDQFEDLDGTGLNQVAKWSENIGNESAYYPQRLFAQLLLNGANTDGSANAYDGVPFFADNTTNSGIGHPVNPYRLQLGGYANWLHGSSSGSYPGALDISDAVTVDVALQNLGKAIAYIANFKMPNGVDPRFLTPAFVIVPPRMAPRIRELTDAKFLAQAATGGAGTGDVQALIEGWGLGTPVIANELAAAFSYTANVPFVVASSGNVSFKPETVTGSDTTYYIVCQEMQTTQLGGLLYVLRKPFKVNYFSGDTQAQLDRMNEFEYHVQGRMSSQYGHPYTILRVDAS